MPPAVPASDLPPNVRSLVERAAALYRASFGGGEREDLPLRCASAPGRVNLIGEHTDYTGGYVLPLAIGYNTVCYGRGGVVKSSGPAGAAKSRIVSSASGSIVEFEASPSLRPSRTDKWANYVQGVVLQYLPDLKPDETFAMDAAFAGDVPLGSGLSSSASLEVATATFLEGAMERHGRGAAYSSSLRAPAGGGDAAPPPRELRAERAARCQRAENRFCGVPCGIMDQFVSSAGRAGRLLLIDCRVPDFREVSVGGGGGGGAAAVVDDAPVLVVANSRVAHDLGAGEYPARVRQCAEATEILARVNPDVESLRDASMDDVDRAASSAGLGGVLLKRARHVVSENKRTVDAADALENGDWEAVGRLMNESHASMRDDYEVSCDEIDVLVDLAQGFGGVYGSRLTGGGFGGCTVTLVRRESSRGLMEHLVRGYERETGKECICFETTPGDGAKAISV